MATLLIEQPKGYPVEKMDVYKSFSKGDLLATGSEMSQDTNYHDGSDCEREAHTRCHKSRRRILLTLVGLLIILGTLLFAVSYARYGFWECTTGALSGLVKRATGDNSNDGNLNETDSVFIHHKYYLIIIFVGLALLLFFAVMLSAWCCRGVFENPLCCPCYLCACCGGLACLECLSCGLCAAAVEA